MAVLSAFSNYDGVFLAWGNIRGDIMPWADLGDVSPFSILNWVLRINKTAKDIGATDAFRSSLESFFHSCYPRMFSISQKTEFIDYGLDRLVKLYADEKLVMDHYPYVEVCNFLDEIGRRVAPRISVHARKGVFAVRDDKNELVRKLQDLGGQKRTGTRAIYRNDTIIRCSDIRKEKYWTLTLQKTDYQQQIRSNLIVDFEDENGDSLRSYLHNKYPGRLPPLDEGILANTLGVAALLFYNDNGNWVPLLIPRPTRKQDSVAVFEGGWHCSASGAAEWNSVKNPNFFNMIKDDMFREIKDELGILPEEVPILAPVAICRELARAGKPQVFFVGFVDLGYSEIMRRIDAARTEAIRRGERAEVLEFPIFRFGETRIEKDFFRPSAARIGKDRKVEMKAFTHEGAMSVYYGFRAFSRIFSEQTELTVEELRKKFPAA